MILRLAAVLLLGCVHALAQPYGCVIGNNAALSFDGAGDFVNCGSNPAGTMTTAFTVEAWVRPSGAGTGIIVNREGEYEIARFSDGTIQFAISSVPLWTWTNTFAAIPVGTWAHIALSWGGGQARLYIDGVEVHVSSAPAPIVDSFPLLNELWIGGRPILSQFFEGQIDEVRLWNVARTGAQIANALGHGIAGNEPGLVGYWRFDEASGQTVFNAASATGTGFDATRGLDAFASSDDPAWVNSNVAPVPYCPPCPNPPCGQVNSPCATLVVNGIGAGAQGPFDVFALAGGTLTFSWSGPPNQPYALVATPSLVPGQVLLASNFIVDVNLTNFVFLFSGFDSYLGPLFFTNAAGTGSQTFALPSVLSGATLNVQGLMYDLGLSCGGLPFMSTASFSIHL